MRLILILLVACIALTALKFAVIALLIVLAVTILWGAFAHPAETLGTFAFFVFASAMANHTVATLAFLGCAGLCLAVTGRPVSKSDASDDP
jgi:hypothetical protein